MEGSVGITFRWFEPIYYEGEQVGFVMVGKYYKDISIINLGIASLMTLLFTLITNWIMKKKLKNINMIDSLKSVE